MAGHIHILGICGTFMGGIALLARELGFEVSGSDAGVYPPMSTQLEDTGISLCEGYKPEHLLQDGKAPDCVIIGNALSRGNPAVEYVLNQGIPYTSGAQWLSENLLQNKWVLAVSGTHGKTTTSSLLAWILEYAGMSPGFLIGGVPANFGLSARSGDSDFFVVEADEYDTAFFDKRSKFVHYRPRTLCINNLEFDHADIFPDLAAIQRQFHHLIRCIPSEGRIVHRAGDEAIADTLGLGCWTETESFAIDGSGEQNASWRAELLNPEGSELRVHSPNHAPVEVKWPAIGNHNVENALSAMAAAQHVGVTPDISAEALAEFQSVKRRLELLGEVRGVKVYDDFAHHPTAIELTLQGLRAQGVAGRIIAVIEPRSNTMRLGQHKAKLAQSTEAADRVYWHQPKGLDWSMAEVVADSPVPAEIAEDIDDLVATLSQVVEPGDVIVCMSNGGFGGIHGKLLQLLAV